MKLTSKNICKLATEVGFDACGIAPIHRLNEDAHYMDNWVARGLHGDMTYLERNCDKRYDPSLLVPGGKTIVVCLLTYEHSGRDYHRRVKSLLYALEAKLKEVFGVDVVSDTHQHIFCDSAPVLERRWCVEAGLGFIGKNHQFIHPELGSMVHPGEIVLNMPIEEDVCLKEVPHNAACADCNREIIIVASKGKVATSNNNIGQISFKTILTSFGIIIIPLYQKYLLQDSYILYY